MSLALTGIQRPRDNDLEQVIVAPTPLESSNEAADQELGFVTAADIRKAQDYGVLAGLQRHLECRPDLKAKAALDIMEPLFASGFSAKVSLFTRQYGSRLLNELEDPVLKAEFAIRVARILDRGAEKKEWVQFAMVLLNDEDVREKCPKPALAALAKIWTEASSHDQTIHWLKAAKADPAKYKEAAFDFYLAGDFVHGRIIYDAAPQDVAGNALIPEESDNFVELITEGLRNLELCKDRDYQASVLKHQDDWKKQSIILHFLCHYCFRQEAMSLAYEMGIHSKTISPLLTISAYITEHEERTRYIDLLLETARKLDEMNEEKHGYDVLNILIKNKVISIQEAILLATYAQSAPSAANALWERVCGVSLKRSKDAQDLRDLQSLLRAFVGHLSKTSASDYMSEYWRKAFMMYVEHGLFDDAVAIEGPWRTWRKTAGESTHKSLEYCRAISLLCNFAIFKYITGNVEGAVEDLREADGINKLHQEQYPDRDELLQGMDYAVKELKRSVIELSPSQIGVLDALAVNARSCERIFACDREIANIDGLISDCTSLFQSIHEITSLVEQSLGRRILESLQYKKLHQKVINGLTQINSRSPAVYRSGYLQENFHLLASELEALFTSLQDMQDVKWNLPAIKRTIFPAQEKLNAVIVRLKEHSTSLKKEMQKLRGK